MNKYILYLPFGYTYLSRIKTIPKLISFILTIPIPCFIFFYFGLLSSSERDLSIGAGFVVSYVCIYIFYENGYIQNDIKTVKKERNPTLRIVGELYDFIDTNYYSIILLRTLFFVFLLFLVLYVTPYNIIIKIISYAFFTSVIYYFHNNIRNAFKTVTFFILSSSRFIFPILIFSSVMVPEKLAYIPLSILIYTLPALLIYSTKSFGLMHFIIGNENKYKIIYYFIMAVVFLLLYLFSLNNSVWLIMLIIFFYMMILVFIKEIIVNK